MVARSGSAAVGSTAFLPKTGKVLSCPQYDLSKRGSATVMVAIGGGPSRLRPSGAEPRVEEMKGDSTGVHAVGEVILSVLQRYARDSGGRIV